MRRLDPHPAGFTGIFGFKQSFGRVPAHRSRPSAPSRISAR